MTGLDMETEEMAALPIEQKSDEIIDRKLIKEGRVEFETDDLSTTRKAILKAVTKYKGFIASDQGFTSTDRNSNTIVIRVPADSFDNLLADATLGVEKFESRDIDVKDVTAEFLDIQARLKTKRELELRYLEILKQAKTVTEILEIEKQAGELRSEIESIEGRLNYLENKISLSTLTMVFYEYIPNRTEFGQKFKNGFENGWNNLIWFFVMLTHIWPFILIVIAVIAGIRIFGKRGSK